MDRAHAAQPLALTMGEPAGIGPQITMATWQRRNAYGVPAFFVVADPDLLRGRATRLGWNIPIRVCGPEDVANAYKAALPVVPLYGGTVGTAGKPAIEDVPMVTASIERAVEEVRIGRAAAVVTNPINKRAMMDGGFKFPGHTEFLGQLANDWESTGHRAVMMLVGPGLRTVPVTVHVPLSEVPRLLTTQLIVETGLVVAHDLERRFGLAEPRLAVSGLNPHAGEGGVVGTEDESVIVPAVEALRQRGIATTGPHPADTLFHESARGHYDAALCMYHDQALIPVKTLAFDQAANVTLGLPFVRTSPDHGTAFDIAGTENAKPDSLIAALKLAAQMAVIEATR